MVLINDFTQQLGERVCNSTWSCHHAWIYTWIYTNERKLIAKERNYYTPHQRACPAAGAKDSDWSKSSSNQDILRWLEYPKNVFTVHEIPPFRAQGLSKPFRMSFVISAWISFEVQGSVAQLGLFTCASSRSFNLERAALNQTCSFRWQFDIRNESWNLKTIQNWDAWSIQNW